VVFWFINKGTIKGLSIMQDRPICTKCSKKPCAVNYRKGEKVYYRKTCDSCARKTHKQKPIQQPRWQSAGYKMQGHCEKCGFVASFPQQLTVHFVDGNLNNTDWRNLKTVCQNCIIELKINGIGWSNSDLVAD
jgi:hypothetical protein